MSKKNGRPESWNADYFPHHTEVSMELKYLEHTYGAEGYRAYWRIHEQLAKADYHYLKLESEYDIQTFRLNCNVPSEILDEVITYLLDRGVLDKEMYDENKLWSPKLIELLKALYRSRRKSPPQKVGTDIVTTCKNPQYSKGKEKERKVSKEKRESIHHSLAKEVLNELQVKYPNVEVNDSYDQFVNYNKSKDIQLSDEQAGFENWLKRDEEWDKNPRKKENKETVFYCVNVYCKCFGKTKKVKNERDMSHPHCDDCEHQMGRHYEYKLALDRKI